VERLRDRHKDVDEEDDRNVVQLMIDQIEFADLVLLNKADLVTQDQLGRMADAVRALNRNCDVLPCTNGSVPIDRLLHTGKFSMARAVKAPGWLESLKGNKPIETEEYGIGSFVYRARKPFHPSRFAAVASTYWAFEDAASESEGEEEEEESEEEGQEGEEEKEEKEAKAAEKERETRVVKLQHKSEAVMATCKAAFGTVLRSKGFLWFASRPRLYGDWNQVGAIAEVDNGGPWFAEQPEEAWPQEEEEKAAIRKEFQEPFGDRRQELVFIGQKLKREAICKALDACLLSDAELARYVALQGDGTRLVAEFPDPMPPWEPEADEQQVEEAPAKRRKTSP